MFEFALAHSGALALAIAAVLLAAVLTVRSESLSLWLVSTWYSFPLVGGIASLARRQAARRLADRNNGASSAVQALCGSYGRFIRVLNRADYDNYMTYLRKAGDLGIRPFPPYLRAVIFSMVLIEAAGLAYVLAGWTLPGASEFAQRIAALGIGFLIAVVLVFFTHWAGLEIDQVNRYRRDRNEWIAAGKVGPLYGPDLSLNDAQSVDDHEPAFRQRATRGHGKTTYVLTTITLLMVLAVGSGAAYVRGQVLEQEIASESAARLRTQQRFDFNSPDVAGTNAGNPEQVAAQEEISIKRRGGWGTLVILMIIFFFLQLLSIFFGYRHSFNGRLSKEAYRALRIDSFSSYSELTQYYDRVADIAQSKVDRLLEVLEHKSRDSMGNSHSFPPHSFRDYLQARDLQRRDKPLGAQLEAAPAPPATLPPVPAASAKSTLIVTAAAQDAQIRDETGVPGQLATLASSSATSEVPSRPTAPAEEPMRGQLFNEFVGPAEEAAERARRDLAERLAREQSLARNSRARSSAKRKGAVPVQT